MWQFLFAYFGLLYANETANSQTWFHVLPSLVNPRRGQRCRQSVVGKLQSHLRCILGDMGSLALGQCEVRSLQVCAMLPLVEEPVLASLANFYLVVFFWVGGSYFQPGQMKGEAIWEVGGMSRRWEFPSNCHQKQHNLELHCYSRKRESKQDF